MELPYVGYRTGSNTELVWTDVRYRRILLIQRKNLQTIVPVL